MTKDYCTGCSACAQACPRHCITMKSDSEGFLYPEIDSKACVACSICNKTCHILHPFAERLPLKAYAAINPKETVREHSSSGGLFSALASQIIQTHGVVFGACFDSQWQVRLNYAEREDELSILRGSKYVQARNENAYALAEEFLKAGRNVLFTGTPCQIAGILHYLKRPYDTLLTVEVACHGVPSPAVWGAYIDEMSKHASKRHAIRAMSLVYKNPYLKAFVENLSLRPSCYHCMCKKGKSGSDLTIADFWGVQIVCPEMHDNRGTSLVLANSEKGLAAFNSIAVSSKEVSFHDAAVHNPALVASPSPHRRREEFFFDLPRCGSVTSLIERKLRRPLPKRMRQWGHDMKEVLTGKYVPAVEYETMNDNTNNSDYKRTDISCVNFRDKSTGWFGYSLKMEWSSE